MGAFRYDALNRRPLKGKTGTHRDSVQISPAIVVAAMPFTVRSTYDFSQSKSDPTITLDDLLDTGERPIQIQHMCSALQVSAYKGNHIWTMSGSFYDPDEELFFTLAPGDWIMAWMMDSQVMADIVSRQVANGRPANAADSGLKFVGRIETVRQNTTTMGSGAVVRTVTLTAAAFTEFDSDLYFDPTIMLEEGTFGFVHSFMQGMKDWENKIKSVALQNINEAVAVIVNIALGAGIRPETKDPSGQLPRSPNESFLIPAIVGKLLGIGGSTIVTGQLTAAELYTIYLGVQAYNDPGTSALMLPDQKPLTAESFLNVHQTPLDLIGNFNPIVVPWYQPTPVWTILEGYLNPVLNEMYTTLRRREDGALGLGLVVRQIPFNSTELAPQSDLPVTSFWDLPRWVIDPIQVYSSDIGRANILRLNYSHIIPRPPVPGGNQGSQGRALSTPKVDDLDIRRSGLRAITQTATVELREGFKGADSRWSALGADRGFGGHMKLSGTVGMGGITDPINPGDNLELGHAVYHIEAVTHSFQKDDSSGAGTFTTSCQISNGLLMPVNGPPTFREAVVSSQPEERA